MWGFIQYTLDAALKRPKLGSKTVKSIFLGYSMHSKAYGFFSLHSNREFESAHAIFFEHSTIKDANKLELEKNLSSKLDSHFDHASSSNIDLSISVYHNNLYDTNMIDNIVRRHDEPNLKRDKRCRIEKKISHDMNRYLIEEDPKSF